MQPIPYAVYAPFHRFMLRVGRDVGIVYSQNLCGFGVAPSALVHRNEVEYSLVRAPMHSEAKSHRHFVAVEKEFLGHVGDLLSSNSSVHSVATLAMASQILPLGSISFRVLFKS
jgi:hypothetical protein